jgi:glycosyltransferase involved in cell wall biosynthesis
MTTRGVHPTRAAEPVVTVVIPTRNRHQFLRRCLTTVLDQVGVDLEVVVVDDASDPPMDTEPELADLFRDPRLRVLRFEQCRGVAAARNEGIAQARGRWTAFIDDDDVWAENKLSAQMGALRRNPQAVWSCTGEVHLGIGLNVFGVVLPAAPEQILERLYRSNSVPGGGSSVVVSTQKLKDLGGFDPSFSVLADWEMWMRLAQLSPPAVVARPLVGYVRHVGGMSLDRRSSLREVKQLEAKHHRHQPERTRVDRFGYYVYLAQREFQLNRARRGGEFLLRAAITRPGAPVRVARMAAEGVVRRLRSRMMITPRPHPVTIHVEKSELDLHLEQWRRTGQLPAPALLLTGSGRA